MLNDKGQCCGRKPIIYKRPPHQFCCRCDKAYSLDTGLPVENWAWAVAHGNHVKKSSRKPSAGGAHGQ